MPDFLEILGYIASLIVLVSLLMSSVKRLRWINLIGSLVFAVYGWLIGAIPVALMNMGIVLINLYYLYQMYGKEDYFQLITSTDQTYFNHFMTFYRDNMSAFMNTETDLEDPSLLKVFILRNMVPAGVVVARRVDDQTLDILIDYVTPAYRDFKIGSFLYAQQKAFFIDQGYQKLITKPGNEKHQRYLKRMGFEPGEVYTKTL